jgi:hypothetical protein
MSRAARMALITVIVLVAVVLLFTVVFPWFDRTFVNDPVIGAIVPNAFRAR